MHPDIGVHGRIVVRVAPPPLRSGGSDLRVRPVCRQPAPVPRPEKGTPARQCHHPGPRRTPPVRSRPVSPRLQQQNRRGRARGTSISGRREATEGATVPSESSPADALRSARKLPTGRATPKARASVCPVFNPVPSPTRARPPSLSFSLPSSPPLPPIASHTLSSETRQPRRVCIRECG